MQSPPPELRFLVPASPDLERTFSARALSPFSDEVMALLESLSEQLLRDKAIKAFPDAAAFGFWCRPASLRAMNGAFSTKRTRLGRGVVFHVAPSNVPLNFAYSLAAGLLAGNANVVRLPSASFPQVDLVCAALSRLLESDRFHSLTDHIVLLRFDKGSQATDYFSSHCDVRVIWGGDSTIGEIRRSALSPRAFDITFPDRYSFCLINAAEYPGTSKPAAIAEGFFNDTLLFDQNACTAPHLVVWLGTTEEVHKAQGVFWPALHRVAVSRYSLQPAAAVNKLTSACLDAVQIGGSRSRQAEDNLIYRIQLSSLPKGIEDRRASCGYFHEYHARDLTEVLPVINRKFQTLSYFGLDSGVLRRFIESSRPAGIDRIVPIGRTLEFSLDWDGHDLIGSLSRSIDVLGA